MQSMEDGGIEGLVYLANSEQLLYMMLQAVLGFGDILPCQIPPCLYPFFLNRLSLHFASFSKQKYYLDCSMKRFKTD